MEQSSVTRRIQSAAWRSTGALPEEARRTWHDEDMKDLGKGRRSPNPEGSGDLDDGVTLLTRPFSLAIIFLIAFAVILTALLWRDGRFDRAIDGMKPKMSKPSIEWMGSKRSQSADYQLQDNPELPMESEMDKALEAAKALPVQAEPPTEVEPD